VDLMWWPVAVAGIACLAMAVVFAMLLPMDQMRRRLRPLANVTRLTRLPEYKRVARSRTAANMVSLLLLAVLFAAALVAGARPTGWSSVGGSQTPEDIMLCVGEPVTSAATGDFLTYFARQATTYGTERIGLTSRNRRVVPLTRDYQYAAGKLGGFAQLAKLQGDLDSDRSVPPAQAAGLRDRAADFAPPVSYTDYEASVADVLALCMTGFPSFDNKSDRRRSLIYLGPGVIRNADESRPALFTDQRVTDMARQAGVQINAITTSPRGTEASLRAVTEATGGRFFLLAPGDSNLSAHLDVIRDNPPDAALPGGAGIVGWTADSPVVPLVAALVVSVLLSLSLAVLRR
jgi:hypothetical protein